MGDPQVLRGYCLLLPGSGRAASDALSPADAGGIPRRHGAARRARCSRSTGALRINYAIFGNVEPALHAHVFPRYVDEPATLRTANPWGYDWKLAPAFDAARDGALLAAIRAKLVIT